MPNFNGPELLIVLAIVVLLFGVGRVSKIGGEMGQAVANFRRGLRDSNEDSATEQQEN